MMTFLIVMTAITLATANYLIWRQPADIKKLWFVALWTVILTASFCMLSPLLLLQGIGVALAGLGLTVPRYGKPIASALTVVACLGTWGYITYSSLEHWQKIEVLRAEFPMASMESRLPEPPSASRFGPAGLAVVENAVMSAEQSRSKHWYFEELHSDHVRSFAWTPGFGPMRMITPLWMQSGMRRVTEVPDLIPQPGPVPDGLDPTGDDWPPAKVRDLFGFHAASVGNFVNAKGFGYLKSRREVAGFAAHGFESVPKPAAYRLERLELVGVVLHPQPVVYVSEFLPRMADLGTLATRPADDFEAAGLAKFAAGEDLTATAVGNKVRLLGAIRNLAQCVDCHGGRRGDLLGAFSYRLAE